MSAESWEHCAYCVPIVFCFLIRGAIVDGTLVPVLEAVRSRPATLYAMYPSRRGMTSAVRVFLELVRARWPSDLAAA